MVGKVRTAKRWHLQQLATLYDSYYESQPFEIEEEPTDEPEKLAARLRLTQPIPPAIPLIVGDILARQPRLRAGDPGCWPTPE
ncbi:MAG TPA: hypothetical protein VFY56_00765 [Propionibacteriaceae bacterium]|nr:hypothetical protein [Propionibacteriaceae bacterium]